MNILVTGANGQLGSELRLVSGESPDHYIFTDINDLPGVGTVKLDITDREAIRRAVYEWKVDAVINCAAFTNVDAAEDNPALAELLNATAVGYLAGVMKETGGLLVHISTDYVFGGDPYNTPCREDQRGTPTGVYGLTKLKGEEAVLESGCRHLIVRTGWLYSEYGKNFLKTMLALTETRPALQVVFDQTGTPTYAYDLAQVLSGILSSRAFQGREGIYHYSNEGVCSWFDFARQIAFLSGHSSCEIRPCHSDEFPSKVHRPAYSVLDKTKIKQAFGIAVPYWTDSLRICLSRLGALKQG
ncbi:MAG: dTDP-4-dehydrorhamnose reductase [Bacteroidales bacterium]|nr:dTDP-4-dehydrorhamnose reductase [Bacteroidales bacterium]